MQFLQGPLTMHGKCMPRATFHLLELEAAVESYKEFIHMDLVSAVNSGKRMYELYVT